MVEHGHAVNRDLIELGYRTDDALIALGDFVSIVLASPSTSAVRYSVERGWSQTDLLLAQHNEKTFGLQYDRPGAEDAQEPSSPIGADGSMKMTPQPLDEFTERMERLRARARAAEEAEQSTTEGVRRVV